MGDILSAAALERSSPRTVTAIARLAVGIGVTATLLLGYALDWSKQLHNPFNYFGYFTNLTSLLAAAAIIITAMRTLTGRHSSGSLTLCRAVAVTCLLIVAVVYNGLVPGTGSAPVWVSISLHAVFPLLMLMDWILVRDHSGLRWSQLWLVLPYPMTWLVIVLIRGVTDGWVPYGFLLPARGVVSLVLHILGLTAALLLAGVLVWATSLLPQRRAALM